VSNGRPRAHDERDTGQESSHLRVHRITLQAA
jgi:hypothetical protein